MNRTGIKSKTIINVSRSVALLVIRFTVSNNN